MIKPGVIYTVSKEYLFLPVQKYHTAAVSPGMKFLLVEAPKWGNEDKSRLAFRFVDGDASTYFFISKKYLDRLVEWKAE